MESTQFKFNDDQRLTLTAHMKRLPADLVQSFLNRCEYAITEWQAEWPEKSLAGNKGAGKKLRALSDAILQVRREVEELPTGASWALWIRLHEVLTGKNTIKPMALQNDYLQHLLALEQMAGTLAGDFAHAGGIVKHCESDLVDRLVQAYFDSSFNRPPSYATNAIFMRFLGELKKILKLPDGCYLSLGRNIAATSIKWHMERAKQLEQWQSGMYEFPAKQGS